ncbi:chymotrypsin-1-like [Rhynchophorus ferrugineus]|uniref:chymotrypsin-1-like n=1 Tax=Rhynchophorus ferrugineus TaxID=354439 RepID=UPI003FCC8322
MKPLLFLVLFVGYCSASLKIVNGTDAEEGEFPFMVSLRHGVDHACGGTIINSKHVLTAAHCVCDYGNAKNTDGYNIQYGSIHITRTYERTMEVEKFICADYNPQLGTNDVAIVRLVSTLPMIDGWQSVYLKNDLKTDFQHDGWVVGWGRLWDAGPIPSVLQKLQVTTLSDSACGTQHDSDHHLCAKSIGPVGGICNGDSGGALIVSGGGQVGIASFITTTCGTTTDVTPDGFSKVSTYYQWIINNSNL